MSVDLRALAATWLLCGRPGVLVEVATTQGSVPREAGTRMLVAAEDGAGTVGGGHLELQAIAHARALLGGHPGLPREVHYALGPSLGQCCGGRLTLRFTPLDAALLDAWPSAPPLFHLQLYGAGHVGRAIARALAPLPVRVDWIDERDGEFPAGLFDAAPDRAWPAAIQRVCVDAVESEVGQAPPGAFFLVLTHRHDLDLRISEAILARADFGYFGLIGSRTKRERFVHHFERRALPAAAIARMTCPIGVPGIAGKQPEVIAAAVVAQLLQAAEARATTAPRERRAAGTSP